MSLKAILLALVARVDASARLATAVSGATVRASSNLTLGTSAQSYAALLQVLNPSYGQIDLLMECCHENQILAHEIAGRINSEDRSGDDPLAEVRQIYQGRCSEVAHTGSSECSYAFAFSARHSQHAAICVPDDRCGSAAPASVGFSGSAVMEILRRHKAEVRYLGRGNFSSCYSAMSQVNTGFPAFEAKEDHYLHFLPGLKIRTGQKNSYFFRGIEELTSLSSPNGCSDRGILFVYSHQPGAELSDAEKEKAKTGFGDNAEILAQQALERSKLLGEVTEKKEALKDLAKEAKDVMI